MAQGAVQKWNGHYVSLWVISGGHHSNGYVQNTPFIYFGGNEHVMDIEGDDHQCCPQEPAAAVLRRL